MARQKTALNKAAEQFACPSCNAAKTQPCINLETGVTVATHRTRRNLVCRETFMAFPSAVISGGEEFAMFCARRTGHRSQHQTLDKRLTWSHDFGAEEQEHPLLSEAG